MTPTISHMIHTGTISQQEEQKWRNRFGRKNDSVGCVEPGDAHGTSEEDQVGSWGIFVPEVRREDQIGDGGSAQI